MAPARGSSRSQTAVNYLRARIASGEWPVGSRIPTEHELMDELGVGRGTIREAVKSLANLGMLEALVSRGTYVRSRTPSGEVLGSFFAGFDPAELLSLRRALEVEAAQSAAISRTDDDLSSLRALVGLTAPLPSDDSVHDPVLPSAFHGAVVRASGNTLLVNLYDGVLAALHAVSLRGGIVDAESPTGRQAAHSAILSAIVAGDRMAAAQAMMVHVDRDLITARSATARSLQGVTADRARRPDTARTTPAG